MPRAVEVVVIGEALVDIVRSADGEVETPGGSPANVALTLGRLGRRVQLIARIGDDARGARVREWLDASHVRVSGPVADRTSTAAAVLDATGAAQYAFDLEWDLPAALAEPGGLDEAPIVHTGSIAAVLAPGADVVSAAVARARHSRVISYDPNVRPSLIDDPADARRRIHALIAAADVVKASDEDVAWLHPGEDVATVAARWLASGPALVVVTRGGEGAVAVARGAWAEIPSASVAVVDTVGAGDTFMGALIDGILDLGTEHSADDTVRTIRGRLDALTREELHALLGRAAAAAAITVSRRGANPPWRAELQEPGGS